MSIIDVAKQAGNEVLKSLLYGDHPNATEPSSRDNSGQIDIASIEDTTKILMSEQGTKYLNWMNDAYGGGPYYNQLQTFMMENDKFQHNTLPPNALHAGYTFITRPKLCLHDVSITKQSEFLPMDTDQYNSLPFAIRCLLDTKFCKTSSTSPRARKCNLVNLRSPFLTPLQNGLIGISGYPDPVLETETTEAGFHSEDQTIVKGYNQMNKTYDLTLDFRDPQHGPVMAILFYWFLYMGYLSKGMMPAYLEDIVQRRLNYTVSIYRFVVDPTKRYIVHYSKATGCYPKSIPLGALFNFSDTQRFVQAAGNFSVNFVANRIEYNKPEILAEFNYLVQRYDSTIKERAHIPLTAEANYEGLPYVYTGDLFGQGSAKPLELTFR